MTGTRRKPITERMKLNAMFHAFMVYCFHCSNAIEPEQPIDWDHYIPLALGGEHHHDNLRPVHRACHHEKTRGTGATTAGSDIGKISKVKRIVRTQKMAVNKAFNSARLALKAKRLKRKWPSRKLEGRGFEKKRKRCSECGTNWADVGKLCPGCAAYREHTGAI